VFALHIETPSPSPIVGHVHLFCFDDLKAVPSSLGMQYSQILPLHVKGEDMGGEDESTSVQLLI